MSVIARAIGFVDNAWVALAILDDGSVEQEYTICERTHGNAIKAFEEYYGKTDCQRRHNPKNPPPAICNGRSCDACSQ